MKIVRKVVMSLVLLVLVSTQAIANSNMINLLTTTGEGTANPSAGRRIKNILIFQGAGWSRLITEQSPVGKDSSWPLPTALSQGGPVGYLSKNSAILLHQMAQIKAMSKDTAIALLIMPDEEAEASGYGTCWNSVWISTQSCTAGGAWVTPKSMFANVAWAAWMKGVQVAPMISINSYNNWLAPTRAAVTVAKLKKYVDWYMTTINSTSLKTTDGKVVILIEGLPENTNLGVDIAQNAELIRYLNSRTDIFWIDNLSTSDITVYEKKPAGPNNVYPGANIYRTAATSSDEYQSWLAAPEMWGKRHLWHFHKRYGSRRDAIQEINCPKPTPAGTVPCLHTKWMNIAPFNADK